MLIGGFLCTLSVGGMSSSGPPPRVRTSGDKPLRPPGSVSANFLLESTLAEVGVVSAGAGKGSL